MLLNQLELQKKGGTSPVVDVLDYTEQITIPGLNLLCTPGNDVESTTALAGSGANIILFTTGLGTPTGNPAVPVLKVSSNTSLYNNMADIIDFNTGTIIEGISNIKDCGEKLLNFVLEVASGRVKVCARKLGQNDFIPWKRACHFKYSRMNKKFSLKNKTAVITGGGSGIGKSISFTLASQDAFVHVLDNQFESALETINDIKKNNFIGVAHQCDVSNIQEVNQVILEICKTSNIDILINNAGIAHVGNIENCQEEDLDRLYNVNIKGVYNCSKAVIPFMKKNKNGLIINLASIASSVGISDRFAYSMTKGAVLTMTYSIAKDYVKDNIRCNCISPFEFILPL